MATIVSYAFCWHRAFAAPEFRTVATLFRMHDHVLHSTGSTTRSELEMSEAIKVCAKKCLRHSDPFTCAEAHAIALIADGWTAEDARQTQIAALKVVSLLAGQKAILYHRDD